jgi:hypothetical protein
MIHIIFYAERSDALGWNIVNSLLFAVFSFYCCRAPIDDQSDVVRLFKRTGIVLRFLKERHFSMHVKGYSNPLLS